MIVFACFKFQKKERVGLALFGKPCGLYFLLKISIGQMVVTA
jgi:hypothetical protein